MKSYLWLIWVLLSLNTYLDARADQDAQGGAKSPSSENALPTPEPNNSFDTLYSAIAGLAISGRQFLALAYRQDYLIANTDWTQNRAYALDVYATSSRIQIPRELGNQTWRAFLNLPRAFLLLDGQNLETVTLDSSFNFVAKHSIVYDLIRPPRDQGGEGTPWEINAFRRQFLSAYERADQEALVGMVQAPESWNTDEASQTFIITTRIPNYLFLTMSCRKEVPSECKIERACPVRDTAGLSFQDVTGLGFSGKRDLLLVGDRRQNRLLAFQAKACNNIHLASTLPLPPRLKTIMSITVDADDHLWVGTEFTDDYFNASIFKWDTW